MKKVSIIIPIYNIDKYIKTCYESVKKQTYTEWELLLINDGSTDESLKICQDIQKKDSRVKVFTQKNSGVSHTRNIGIKESSGYYIMFIDGDDFIENNTLEELVKNIEEKESDMCFAKYYYKDSKKIKSTEKDFEIISGEELIKYHLKFEFMSSLCFSLFKRDKIKDIRLAENLKNHEDWEYLLQIIQRCKKISCCDGCFYHYITRMGSSSKSKLNEAKMSLFDIPTEVNKKLKNKEKYREYLDVLEVQLLLKIIVIYSTCGTEKKEFKRELCQIARKNLYKSFKSKKISKKQKIYVLLIAINPIIFKMLFKIKNGVHL